MLENMWRGAQGLDIYQAVWALLSSVSTIWFISHSGPGVQAISSQAYPTMPVVAKILSMAILLWAESCPTQLLFCIVQERMTAQNPPATHLAKSVGRKCTIRYGSMFGLAFRNRWVNPVNWPLGNACQVSLVLVLQSMVYQDTVNWPSPYRTSAPQGVAQHLCLKLSIWIKPLYGPLGNECEVPFCSGACGLLHAASPG